MRVTALILSSLILGLSLTAQPLQTKGPPLSATGFLELVPGVADKTASELTLAERASLADALSVRMQAEFYTRRAAISSFLLPGTGQFMIGEPLAGSLFAVAELAVLGGSLYGSYLLLPDSWRAAIGNHAAMRALMTSGAYTQALPSMGVMAGGLLLATVNSMISSHLAYRGAVDRVASGKVEFAPRLLIGRQGLGMGLHLSL